MKDFSIRLAEVEDLNQLQKVARQTYTDHFTHIWEDAGKYYMENSFNKVVLKNELTNPNHLYFLGFEQEKAVGYMKLNIDQLLMESRHLNSLELERIYIRKNATGLGLGRQLIQLAFKEARERHKDLIWLKSMDSSTASIAFYEKQGFVMCGKDQLEWPFIKPEYRGMVVMKKQLKRETT
mgnify:CR=1 FL=1